MHAVLPDLNWHNAYLPSSGCNAVVTGGPRWKSPEWEGYEGGSRMDNVGTYSQSHSSTREPNWGTALINYCWWSHW